MADRRERIDSAQEAVRAALDGRQAALWTALPGIVQSYDAAAGTVVVQPAIKGDVTAPDGSRSQAALPLMPDVPVVWQGAGGFTLTLPVAAGDECLVVFASRSIDAWWQDGGVQPALDARMHDLSDGFALIGPRSQSRRLSAVSTTAAQLRSDDGDVFLEVAPGGKVRVVAPGGVDFDTPEITTTGKITARGDVVAGTISAQQHRHLASGGSGIGGPPAP